MLGDNPPVVNYIRRVVLEPSENQLQLLDSIVDFTRSEIGMLRDAGLASKKRPESPKSSRFWCGSSASCCCSR
jgi:hypothetical protein